MEGSPARGEPQERPAPPPAGERGDWKPVAVLVAVGALIRCLLAIRTPVINTDALGFLDFARGFLAGDLSAATRAGFHPLYSALIALGGGSETAGIAVSVVAGALAGWPMFHLARDLSDRRTALAALFLYELQPGLIGTQSDVFADGLFLLLAAGAICGAIRFVVMGRGLWLATVAASIGCLAKSEGLIIAVLTAGTVGWGLARSPDRRAAAAKGVAALLIALAIVGPYVLHLSLSAGRVRVSPKPMVEMVAGVGEKDEESGSGTWLDRRERHGRWIASLWYLGTELGRVLQWIQILLLLAAAVTARRWGPRLKGKGWIGLWIGFFVFCVWWANAKSAHQISGRYLNPPAAFLTLFPAAFAAWFFTRGEATRTVHRMGLVLVFAAVVLTGMRQVVLGRRADQVGFRLAGEWILSHRGAGAVIASTNDKPVYYARGAFRALDDLAPVEAADFLIFTDRDVKKRGWDLKRTDLSPFRLAGTFPETPDKKVRTVYVMARAR